MACIDFAKRNGCGSILVVNLFAFRSPHPKVMAPPRTRSVRTTTPI
jgi:hypothetical protein